MRNDLIFHDIEQGTPEWYAARLGRITGSSAKELLVNGKGADGLGVGAWSLIYQLAGDIVTGQLPPVIDNYWTERGKELEAEAIDAYMDATFHQVNRIGFIEWGRFAGCSPDGMIDDQRGAEVKCLSAREHFRFCHARAQAITDGLAPKAYIEKEYYAQIQWSLFVTGFEVWDYIHYHPNAGAWTLIIDEVRPDNELHDLFAHRLELVSAKVEEVVEMAGASVSV